LLGPWAAPWLIRAAELGYCDTDNLHRLCGVADTRAGEASAAYQRRCAKQLERIAAGRFTLLTLQLQARINDLKRDSFRC
jgi:hypothetical protein